VTSLHLDTHREPFLESGAVARRGIGAPAGARTVNESEFVAVISDPAARHARYRETLPYFYGLFDDLCRHAWGDSFHFAVFSGSQTVSDAVVATERMVADEGGFGSGMHLLEVGCGIGGPALTIAAYTGAHVTGVDIVPRHVETARRRASEQGLSARTSFELGDAHALPFADESFDHVYAFESACHSPDKQRFYDECARVLRPGGCFLGTDWAHRDGLTAEEDASYIQPVCRLYAVPHLIGPAELRRHLGASGLETELVEDLAERGDVTRNWKPLPEEIVRSMRSVGATAFAFRTVGEGWAAVSRAARAGAFVLVHWRARKPARAETVQPVTGA
jgi:sterol 24-C-methyltransferase